MQNNDQTKETFEAIYRQNKNRIHFQLHKLGIHDPHNEYFTEGIYAMWNAYKKYQPNNGPMGTYFNHCIRFRLIDMLRKRTADLNHLDRAMQMGEIELDDGNHFGTSKLPLINKRDINVKDDVFWQFIRSRLSDKQWTWVYRYIIEGLSQKEIAEHEGVSIDAVKSWARTARKILRQEETNLRNLR